MAGYMVRLDQFRCAVCTALATRRVYNGVNSPVGDYCMFHARREVEKLNAPTRDPSPPDPPSAA